MTFRELIEELLHAFDRANDDESVAEVCTRFNGIEAALQALLAYDAALEKIEHQDACISCLDFGYIAGGQFKQEARSPLYIAREARQAAMKVMGI